LLIDLAVQIHGDEDMFVDFVHFSPKGHAYVAKYIANELSKEIAITTTAVATGTGNDF
jgi:phospholipase/lecithinase/hemolysin